MATKKQRRRVAKERRHEWEFVEYDDDGTEVVLEVAPSPKKESQREAPTRGATRAARPVPPPSWRRSIKMALLFAPILFLVTFWLDDETPYQTKISVALIYSAAIVPFLYMTSRLTYRTYLRRLDANAKKPR